MNWQNKDRIIYGKMQCGNKNDRIRNEDYTEIRMNDKNEQNNELIESENN